MSDQSGGPGAPRGMLTGLFLPRTRLSLQLLLILEALRIGVEHPALLITSNAASPPRPLARPAPMPLQSSQTNHDDASVDAQAGAQDTESQSRSTTTTRKKKRKAAPARRWTGFATAMALQGAVDDDGFPWAKRSTSSTKSGGTDLVTPGGENDDDDDEAAAFNAKTTVRDPEALHRLFEAFADRLSLRIVTSELRLDFLGLDEEMDKQAGEGSAAAKAAKTKAILFGTAARLREDGDERDEMHHLCSDIVEPRFARSLPRQCSVLRSKATVGGGGSHATPHRSRSSLSTTTGRGGTASAERQRRREEQQHSQLARIRSEADLATRKKLADEKARVKEAKRLSQRPGLKDALVMEQKERKFTRATSVVGGDAERNKREVSVKRRVGSLVRGASSGNVWDGSSQQQSQSAPAIPTMMKSGSLVLGPSAARVNKRKIAEPKRFGGHADGQVVKGELDDDVDNPFRDSKSAALAAAEDSQASSSNGSKRLKPTTGVFTRSESQVFSSKAASSSQSQGPFSASLLAPPPIAAAGRRSLTGWQRTESQPVTSRDLSSLSSAGTSRSSSRQGSRRTSPFLVDDDDGGEGSDAGLDDDEDEEEADAPMLLRRPTNAFAAAASQSQSGIGGSRPLHGLGGLRTWTKTTSMAELPAFDLPISGNGQSESQPNLVPSGGLQESQGAVQESQRLAAAAREFPPLEPSTSSIITSAPAAAASQSDTSLAPTQPTVSLTAASPPRPRPPMAPPLRRRPSGRNPFAKSASQQRLETATVVAAAAAADQSTSQAAALGEEEGPGETLSNGSSMAADLGRLWRGDSSKWG